MIRCGKCGKYYDYEKYDGICPQCARYNRPDSKADMEQELHDRYDSDPHAHKKGKAHAAVHQNNQDSYRHKPDEYAPSHATYTDTQSSGGRGRFGKVLVIVLIVIFVLSIAVTSVIISVVEHSRADVLTGLFDEDTDADVQEIDSEYEDRVYVNYAWADYLGEDLTEVDWEEDTLIWSDDVDPALIETVKPEDGFVYYVVYIEVMNNQSGTALDLTGITAAELTGLTAVTEDGQAAAFGPEALYVFDSLYSNVEHGEDGYVNVLMKVPEDAAELNGTLETAWDALDFTLNLYKD